jgi:hypothetical protein
MYSQIPIFKSLRAMPFGKCKFVFHFFHFVRRLRARSLGALHQKIDLRTIRSYSIWRPSFYALPKNGVA